MLSSCKYLILFGKLHELYITVDKKENKYIVNCNILTLWDNTCTRSSHSFWAVRGVQSDVVSRSPHILIDVNGKEHSDLGINTTQIP